MWLKIIKKAPCYRLAENLSLYIKHDGSISSGSKMKLIKHHYIMWRVAEKKNPISASILTMRNLIFGVIKKVKYRESVGE